MMATLFGLKILSRFKVTKTVTFLANELSCVEKLKLYVLILRFLPRNAKAQNGLKVGKSITTARG
jgi:hypothetical protein